MSIDIDLSVFEGADPIHAIAEDVFAAMIDGEPGRLGIWPGVAPELVDPVHAWVDVDGATSGRVLLSTEHPVAEALTRALLSMDAEEPVEHADMVDAFGEVANVVGGNVKALVPDAGALSLPQVGAERPSTGSGALLHELSLEWRGRPLVISLWSMP